jgi:hypothetical protein
VAVLAVFEPCTSGASRQFAAPRPRARAQKDGVSTQTAERRWVASEEDLYLLKPRKCPGPRVLGGVSRQRQANQAYRSPFGISQAKSRTKGLVTKRPPSFSDCEMSQGTGQTLHRILLAASIASHAIRSAQASNRRNDPFKHLALAGRNATNVSYRRNFGTPKVGGAMSRGRFDIRRQTEAWLATAASACLNREAQWLPSRPTIRYTRARQQLRAAARASQLANSD